MSQIQKLHIRPVTPCPYLLYSALEQAYERTQKASFIADQSMETLLCRKAVSTLSFCNSCSAKVSDTKYSISVLLRASVLSNYHIVFKYTSVVLQLLTNGSIHFTPSCLAVVKMHVTATMTICPTLMAILHDPNNVVSVF
jgi:hypothetical protein